MPVEALEIIFARGCLGRVRKSSASRNVSELEFESYQCDITSYSEIKDVTKKSRVRHNKARALINAAGIASMNLALTTPSSLTERLIQTNLIGTIYCCQLFAPF